MEKYTAIRERAEKYSNMLDQVVAYRKAWDKKLKKEILKTIKAILTETGLEADVKQQKEIKGMEVIGVRLGSKKSGLYQEEDGNDRRDFFKEFGGLYYSQLFNGKVQVWMSHPFIEGLMEPKQPKLIGIYAPPEFDENLILGHFATFLKELTDWEDYDDDDPGQQAAVSKIGFGMSMESEEE